MADKQYHMTVDPLFRAYFNKRIQQVFLYLTDVCNLSCRHCLYKPNLEFQVGQKEIPYDHMLKLLTTMRSLGAYKLSILGGEPTLYKEVSLGVIVTAAKKMGYSYIRLVTNGQFDQKLLRDPQLQTINEISFSLDGYTAPINDFLRGKGSFYKCVARIKQAIQLKYRVQITACVHRKMAVQGDLIRGVQNMIRFAEQLKVQQLNFHVLLKVGFPMDTWTGETDIPYREWIRIYKALEKDITNKRYTIIVRVPRHFIPRTEFKKSPQYYGYCAVKQGERVLIHPDGLIRICSGLICSKYCIARYDKDKIVWEKSATNESSDHVLGTFTPCTNQSKNKQYGKYIPLCFSFKPNQKEVIWENIKWESRKLIKL